MEKIKIIMIVVIFLVFTSIVDAGNLLVVNKSQILWQLDIGDTQIETVFQENNFLSLLKTKKDKYLMDTINIIDGKLLGTVIFEIDPMDTSFRPKIFHEYVVFIHDKDHKISVFDKKTGEKVSTLNILDIPGITENLWIYSIEDIQNDLLIAVISADIEGNQHKICFFDIQESKARTIQDVPIVSKCFIKNDKIFAFTNDGMIVYDKSGTELLRNKDVKKHPTNIMPESFKLKDDRILWMDRTWDVMFYILDTKTNEIMTKELLSKCDCECGFPKYYSNDFYNVITFGNKDGLDIQHIIVLSNNGDVLYEYEYNSTDTIWVHGIVGNKLILSDNQSLISLDIANNDIARIKFEGVIDYFDPVRRVLVSFNDDGYLRAYQLEIDFGSQISFSISSRIMKLGNIEYQMDTTPVIVNNRTLLPARFVTEPLGGSVTWNGDEKKVVCTLADKTVELWIGKSTAKINGQEVQIDPNNPDVVPTIINDRTMVPMRFLAESLGCEVEWVAETKEIILTYPNE